MTPLAKQIGLIEKKLGHIDNDITKLIIKDLLFNVYDEEEIASVSARVEPNIGILKTQYKIQLQKLRNKQKQASKQIDLEDAIADQKRIKSLGQAYNC